MDRQKYRLMSGKLWRISYPAMIATALQSIYDIVDMAWVGQISKEATAAITLYSALFWIFAVFNEVIVNSSVSMLAQAYGKKDYDRFQKITENTLGFKTLVGILSALVMYLLLEPGLRFFLDKPQVVELALEYGRIRTVFMPLMFISYSINTVFRSMNKPKEPMYIMFFATIMNIILDPIMMFEEFNILSIRGRGLGLGIFGAALATVISIVFSVLLGNYMLKRADKPFDFKIRNTLRIDKKIARNLIMVGLPSGFEVLFRNISMAVVLKFVSVYGTATVSAAGIGTKLFGFAFMPVYGFLAGGSTLIGKYLGREELEKADLVARASSYNSFLFLGVLGGLAMVFSKQLMWIFTKDPLVIRLGMQMIRYTVPALFIAAFIFGRAVVFLGSGYNMPLVVASVVARWFVQIPLLFLFVTILNKPVKYVWITFVVAEFFDFAIMYYYYRRGDWMKIRV